MVYISLEGRGHQWKGIVQSKGVKFRGPIPFQIFALFTSEFLLIPHGCFYFLWFHIPVKQQWVRECSLEGWHAIAANNAAGEPQMRSIGLSSLFVDFW